MTILSDTQIIDNTHFHDRDDGKVECFTALPGGEEFREVVPEREAVTKNMIAWCNTVREYLKVQEESKGVARGEERKARQEPLSASDGTSDPKVAVLEWFSTVQSKIDHLGEQIDLYTLERNALRDERDRIEPIIKAWKGGEA